MSLYRKSLSQAINVSVYLLSGLTITTFLILSSSENQLSVLLPMCAAIAGFLVFCICLSRRFGSGIVGEIGFLYVSFVIAYTVLPAIGFIILNFDFPSGFDGLNFSILIPKPTELGEHLWRHCIFLYAVIIGYLILRGRNSFSINLSSTTNSIALNANIALFLVFVSMVIVMFFSAPVVEYFDHYTRFDHLPDFLRGAALLSMLVKTGAYYFFFAFLFENYKKYKWYILIALIGFVSVEIYYSLGSRIASLSLLLLVISLYNTKVNRISLRNAILYFSMLGIFFTIIEGVRASNYDTEAAISEFSDRDVKIALEFGAVFYTSFHIYAERNANSLPSPDPIMFFGDFLDFVPFIDHTKYNSQYWYASQYFPNAVVPPQTMGPIADSGIWGGELDLFFRGLVTGLFYGILARWAASNLNIVFVSLIYSYSYANCIMSLKYSFIHQLSDMLKILLPTFIVIWVTTFLYKLLRFWFAKRWHHAVQKV